MKKQGRKLILVFTVFVIINTPLITAFEYDESSLREEITETSIHVDLEEGYYHLVIDNTGYVSGEYDRVDSFVEIEIFIIFGDPDYISDSRNLGDFVYWDIPIPIGTLLFPTLHLIFNITATEPVTVFLTDEEGFTDFEEEVMNFDFREPISAFLIIGIILGVVIVLGISAGLIERVRKKDGQEKPDITENIVENIQGTQSSKIGSTAISVYYCKQCNEEYLDKIKVCINCGSKLKKIKREIEEAS